MIEVFYISAFMSLYQASSVDIENEQLPVEVEEVIGTYTPPNNGAGPLWCYGAPLLVRREDYVFLNTMETGKDVPPLCNTRWQLFRRDENGWKLQQHEADFQEREPCPIIGFADGRLFLSINPSLKPRGTRYGECDPYLLQFSAEEPQKPGVALRPRWPEDARFTDHSYRGIAADSIRGEILLLNIHSQTGEQLFSFLDETGVWSKQGRITFPIRSCYPQVALQNRAAHVLAIGDIVEPNEEWRKYKREQTGREWDYVFRRLFYTWTEDITSSDFETPIELDNVDATGGYIRNLDVWLDSEGAAHILYLKQPVQSALLRDKFFPDQPLTTSLEYCVLQGGKLVSQSTLVKGGEGEPNEIPGNARFHATDDGRLFVIYYCSGKDNNGKTLSENRLLQILPEPQKHKAVKIDFQEAFTTFFTATERGGSAPSKTIDLFGVGRDSTILRYARIAVRQQE